MITPKEIDRILAQRNYNQKTKGFGFDAGIAGLGVGTGAKNTKKKRATK